MQHINKMAQKYYYTYYYKEQKTNPESYRGITLLYTTNYSPVYSKAIIYYKEQTIENKYKQEGFPQKRSASDALFIIREIKENVLSI